MSGNPPGPPFPHFTRHDHPLYIEGFNAALDECKKLLHTVGNIIPDDFEALRKEVLP